MLQKIVIGLLRYHQLVILSLGRKSKHCRLILIPLILLSCVSLLYLLYLSNLYLFCLFIYYYIWCILVLTSFTFSNSTNYYIRLTETSTITGSICVSASFRLCIFSLSHIFLSFPYFLFFSKLFMLLIIKIIAPYEELASNTCFKSRPDVANPYGEISLSPPYQNATISQFKLDYLNGGMSCSDDSFTYHSLI